jgi:acyl-[acyl-carrier-protein]-phospholipid O-acyltransferase/long-chain-fatty-acid--[acyl-carrier-protein] ligase
MAQNSQPQNTISELSEVISPSTSSQRGFWSLIVTQFQGAFSDNVLKNLVVFMMLGAGLTQAEEHSLGEQVTALFSLPFILFSMAGGFLADRFSKRHVMIGVKVFEVFVMLFVLAGFALHERHMLLAGIFLMGTHSAFFGPSKYSSLPELLPEKRLSWGNGILELGTFVAIIFGIVVAGLLSEKLGANQIWSGLILIALAFLGLVASLGITHVPAANPAKTFRLNFVGDLLDRLRPLRSDRPMVLAITGNIYFSFLGSLLLLNLFFYGHGVLHVSKLQTGYLNGVLALGIGFGSVAAGYLSGGKIEYGLVPLGALGMSVVCLSLGVPNLSFAEALVRLALLGFFGGFFIVPVMALLQHRPDKAKKGEVLAAANLLSFVGVFLVWPAHYLLTQVAHLTPQQVFLFGGVITLAGAAYALWLLPDALLRFVLWLLTHTFYRIRVIGRDNIPAKGGALFVCNHLSHVDALLLLASTDRQIRFIMYKGIYELPWVKPLARILGVIPISSEQRPREMIQSLKTASEAIKAGHVVCIFAEGQITRIGQLLPFRRGFERIMKDVDAPIIPIALDGVWGSIFSFEKKRFLWKLPRKIPYPVTVTFGKPMPHTATPGEVRQVTQQLMSEAWNHRKAGMRPLGASFVRTARRHPFRFAMAEAESPKLRFAGALSRTIFLARRFRKAWSGQKMVGLLLPPSIPGALVNYAALLSGKVPVNLNYTLAEETLSSCIRQCDIKTVVTSKTFLEKIKLKLTCETLFIEEIAEKPSAAEKLVSFLTAWFLPVAWLQRFLGQAVPSPHDEGVGRGLGRGASQQDSGHADKPLSPTLSPLVPRGERELSSPASASSGRTALDDLATIIFSSGSTGEPKGVMLSHYNILSNAEQLEQVFGMNARDRLLGVLPFFHSFGFTGTLCLPAVLGVGVVYHPNPLDAKTIGPLVGSNAITFLLATPTFLQLYMRACTAEDFGSLRVVMTGAEKLPDRLAAAFEEHFGIRPLEAYGCTECSPAVAVNTHDFRSAGFRQVGGKRGKIGHPLPGISIRIVDPNQPWGEPLPSGQAGLMLVHGPNIMQGYLGRPDKTAEVLKDGWYVTGDIAALDDDGFLQITDRLSRFSKIGGEMVPHIKVEEKLHELAGLTEQSFIVAGVPDEKKGERLVVLHKVAEEPLRACLEKLAQCSLPNLWKPRADQFFKIETFPYLGTGKVDLRKVRELALQRSADTIASAGE